ncbi:uncharacterized protein FA14DRAFT_172437 [Meira miltonrushii]|uniref:Uncharacterized protein n=1 Tax=Meira miltonrushii TaxID=1280837 RepID=A0A316VHL4_9BASI|nr:uncharacterized protein FA14DRAFT_172437 [Meira miltonrushii]PWN35833.1 hypothetical protein FA14DRAFT_172437 [Meira miltonrushii]
MRSFSSLIRQSRRRGRPPNGIVRYAWDSEYNDPCKAKKAIFYQQSTSMTSIRNGECSTSVVRDDISQSRGRIRTIHSTGIHPKPPPSTMSNGRIYSIETALPGTDHSHPYIPDGSQILTEWRLLERRLLESDRKGKSREIENNNSLPNTSPQSSTKLDPKFFSENERPSLTITLEDEDLQESLIADESDRIDRKVAFKPLWTASVDQSVMRECIQSAIDEVRKGESDIDTLATKMLQSIENASEAKTDIISIPRSLRLEELRMLLLSAWISITSEKIDLAQSHNVPAYLFLTQEMYFSTAPVAELAKGVDQEYARSVMAVQRATLFRLFGVMFHLSQSELKISSKTRIEALLLCSKLTCDPRLRPAQVQYFTRKVLGRLRAWVEKKDDCVSSSRLWCDLRDMLFDLMGRGLIQSCPLPKDGSEQMDVKDEISNPITNFLLCCSKTIGNGLGPEALAYHTLLAMAQRASIGREEFGSNEKRAIASTPEEVEMMIAELMRGNDPRTAYQLYSLTPSSLRSIDSTCRLMRHYGNAPLCFSSQPSSAQDSRWGSGRTSRALMADISSKLSQLRGADREDCLRNLAHARFAYCADRGLAGRAMDELRDFVEVKGGKSQTETLIELGEPVYCHFIRSLAHGKWWSSAKEYAFRLSKYQTPSGVRVLDESNRVKMLNILLSSYLWPMKSGKEDELYIPHLQTASSNGKGDLSRWTRTWSAMSIVKNFCEETGVIPDEKSAEYLIFSFRQCNQRRVSKKVLDEVTSMHEWNWQKKGVQGVLERIEAIVQAGRDDDIERKKSNE